MLAAGKKVWRYNATGSIRVMGTLLLGNGLSVILPFTTVLEFGSKIWPTGETEFKPGIGKGPNDSAAPKFPLSWAVVGMVAIPLFVTVLWRNCSKLKKKKVLSLPL